MTNFPGARSTPLIHDGLGYLLSGLGKLVCFNADDGETVWTRDLYADFTAREVKFGMTENLLIDGDKLYCTPGGVKNNVLALDRRTGDLVWSSTGNMEASAYCSPRIIEIYGKRTLLTHTALSIIALDPEDGSLLWSHDMDYPHGIHGNVPIYHEGYIFAMNGWGFGSVMMKVREDGSGVEEVWRSHLFDLEHGDALKIGNNIYGTDYTTRHFSCVDWYTGHVKDSLDQFAPGTVVAADGMIYCYSYFGDVALIKPLEDGFEVVSSFELPGHQRDHIAHPVIHGRRLYLRHAGTLWVYDIADKNKI
jgi:outer membrane protein assembly factor BamB